MSVRVTTTKTDDLRVVCADLESKWRDTYGGLDWNIIYPGNDNDVHVNFLSKDVKFMVKIAVPRKRTAGQFNVDCEKELDILQTVLKSAKVVNMEDFVYTPHKRLAILLPLFEMRLNQFHDNVLMKMSDERERDIQRRDVITQILTGLVNLHTMCIENVPCPIIHGDIQPENILVNLYPLTAVIAGLNFAVKTSVDPITKLEIPIEGINIPERGIDVGRALNYMPPEAEMHLTTKADVWAMGCVLVELCWDNNVPLFPIYTFSERLHFLPKFETERIREVQNRSEFQPHYPFARIRSKMNPKHYANWLQMMNVNAYERCTAKDTWNVWLDM